MFKPAIKDSFAFKLNLVLLGTPLLCLMATVAQADSSIGLNTPQNVQELPIAVQGQVGLDLMDKSITTATTTLQNTTNPPNVIIPGNVGIGMTSLPASTTSPLTVNGPVQVGTTTAACTSSNLGAIRVNTTNNSPSLEWCNGTQWMSAFGSTGWVPMPPGHEMATEWSPTDATLGPDKWCQQNGYSSAAGPCRSPLSGTGPATVAGNVGGDNQMGYWIWSCVVDATQGATYLYSTSQILCTH